MQSSLYLANPVKYVEKYEAYLIWFASRLKNQSLLWGEWERFLIMQERGYSESKIFSARFLPSVMLWASKDTFKNMKLPT